MMNLVINFSSIHVRHAFYNFYCKIWQSSKFASHFILGGGCNFLSSNNYIAVMQEIAITQTKKPSHWQLKNVWGSAIDCSYRYCSFVEKV